MGNNNDKPGRIFSTSRCAIIYPLLATTTLTKIALTENKIIAIRY